MFVFLVFRPSFCVRSSRTGAMLRGGYGCEEPGSVANYVHRASGAQLYIISLSNKHASSRFGY